MGNSKSKLPRLQKLDLEIQVEQIFQHLTIARDRKIGELAKKEITLREKMQDRLYSYDDIVMDMMAIVTNYKYIVAVKTVMRYCKIVKGYSIRICEAQNRNNFNEISDIQPYIEGIIWSTNKLNIKYIQDFNKLIYSNFGPEVYQRLQ